MIKNFFKKFKNSKIRILFVVICLALVGLFLSTYFSSYGEFVSRIPGAGGVQSLTGVGTTDVVLDDLKSDWYYYMGLNYTTSSSTALPTASDKKIYTDENLVQVKIKYSGKNEENTITGYVSKSERQYNYVYYKIFPVNTNGTSTKSDDYISIDLIDNPFTDRPSSKAFNGWLTNYRGVKISLDTDVYVRTAKIPVTYTDNVPDVIDITFNAVWFDADWTTVSNSRNWTTAFGNLKSVGFNAIGSLSEHIVEYAPYDMTGYFASVNIPWLSSYAGYYNNRGVRQTSGYCNTYGGCTYYRLIENEYLDDDQTYYYIGDNGRMTQLNVSTLSRTLIRDEYVYRDGYSSTMNMAGFYLGETIARYDSLVGYYNSSGKLQTSGTCNTRGGCTGYYRLLDYYDSSNNPNTYDPTKTYYYFTTRDTNIVVMTSNLSNTWGTNQNKPFTLTSVYNTDYSDSVTWNVSGSAVNAYADTVIENIKINYGSRFTTTYDPPINTTTSGVFYARYFNVKIGRGITRNNTNGNFRAFVSGSQTATGSSNSLTRYKIIIESGYYNSVSLTDGASTSTNRTSYLDGHAIYGNDYDRANLVNSNLDVYYCASGGWSTNIYSSSNNTVGIDLTVKSGTFGSSKHDLSTGIYVGGRYSGTHYAIRKATIEGGYIYNLIGGPLTTSNKNGQNDILIYIKGGTIDMVTAGAGTSATYGNRIVQMTGGKVNYSVFGGSNGSDGDDGDGTLKGSSYVYVGGTSVVGDSTLISNETTLYGAESGAVFGIGNGRSTYETIGSNDGSVVIINDEANINNVYGGGNYSAVGVSSGKSTTTTTIKILGGTISNNVYGGGNNNGSGSSSCVATVDIEMTGGSVEGAIYGGSNEKGNIYGSVNIKVNGGTVGSVYGGGKGGYLNNNNPGTYVARNVDITIGDNDLDISPTITGSVYGGSAFGTVNGTTRTTNLSSYHTYVTVNKGNILNVFGGGQGDDTYTPYVEGNILVTINNGTITNVFGGNDAKGVPNGSVIVRLNGGTITNTYGGGNKTGVTTTNVYLQGATATNIFGGSNQSGDVTTSNVLATSGSATNIYGGNNKGGVTTNANVTVNGSNVTGSVYGGGELATTTTAIVDIESGVINNVFGGGNSASLTNPSNITINGGTITNVYGGSNQTGNVPSSNIYANSGTIENIFGANNAGGSTNITNIKLNGATITDSVYGGGNEASSEHSHIELKGSSVNNIFGGGNQAGLIESDIKLIDGTVTNVYGGSNQLGNVTTSNIYTFDDTSISNQNLVVTNVYGGNNEGGKTSTTNINLDLGDITNVFGGGNLAPVDNTNVVCNNITINGALYGGGNQAAVNNNTNLDINSASIGVNVFGGGNDGEVLGNTNVYVTSSNIGQSVYAGGNGNTATVYGKTLLYIDGSTEVGQHVFGGGNAAATGTSGTNNSSSEVNIAGANIHGNVYGGANTSVINGIANVNIGYDTITNNQSLIKDTILIGGTVFGGGEANASGSEEYDFSFISVTNGINIKIDANGHSNFDINGSIFGSGNASSSGGYSYIDIYNYGTKNNVKKNVSLQRADSVAIYNSHIELNGATDRTNEYANVLFSISRVSELKLKNNSSLYLRNGANLLKHYVSAIDVNGVETLGTVTIDDENKTVTKNVDNRIYTFPNKPLNIAKNEKINDYGEVDGMSFFGLYQLDRSGNPVSALYDSNYDYESSVSSNDAYYFDNGSYVLGMHENGHNIKVDGFYSNYVSDDNKIITKYIEPTPEDSNFYMWTIGEQVTSYEMTITASKYLTLGTEELALSRHTTPNTIFSIVGFNYNELNPDVNLVNELDVPRIAHTSTDADNTMALVMKSSISGWMTNGKTMFLSDENTPIIGTVDYYGENGSYVPTLQFYLYHSKNLGSSGDMGVVTISLLAITPIDDLNNKVERVNVIVNLKRALYNTNDYEASISPGKQYELFASNAVNITSRSSFSTYYSLFVQQEEGDTPLYQNGYHRVLTSTYVLPLNTKITMIDYSNHSNPEYYYFVVDSSVYSAKQTEFQNYGEATYSFSDFIKMGSTSSNNNYKDNIANQNYYDAQRKIAQEEFIFIVDFGDADINSDILSQYLLIELRDSAEQTRVSVLGIEQELMVYNVYTNKDALIDVTGSIAQRYIYPGDKVNLNVNTSFSQQTLGSTLVHDTKFFENQLGIKITLFDSDNQQVTGTSLLGFSFTLNNESYYPRVDGSTRIKIADKISNVASKIKINTTDALAPGNYTMKIEVFGSVDGIYYGLTSSDYVEIPFIVMNTVYGLNISVPDKQIIINRETGKNLNDNNITILKYMYDSSLSNAKLHISLKRRDYSSIYSTTYNIVDLKDYISNEYDSYGVNNEYIIPGSVVNNATIELHFKENLVSGTYKIVLSLYDGDSYIGEVYQYIIIK